MKAIDSRSLYKELSNLPKDLIKTLIEAARNEGINRVAIIGGVIRDKIIEITHEETLSGYRDIDILVEGSANKLAMAIQHNLGVDRTTIVRKNESYKTIALLIDGIPIDLSSARLEKYLAPAENPKIINTNLENDLCRRDFTINSIALDLTEGKIIDLFEGIKHINRRELQFLHENSVTEDPTRVIRAARYSARLNFNLSSKSIDQVKNTITSWPWSWQPGHPPHLAPPALSTRLRMELELLMNKEKYIEAIKHLKEWGGLQLLDESLQKDLLWQKRIRWASRLGIKPLIAFISGAKDPSSLAARLQLPETQQKLLKESCEIKEFFSSKDKDKELINWTPSNWTQIVEEESWDPDSVAIAICNGINCWRPLLKWWGKWRLTKAPISAEDLIKQGWRAGPELGKELKKLRYQKLDQEKFN